MNKETNALEMENSGNPFVFAINDNPSKRIPLASTQGSDVYTYSKALTFGMPHEGTPISEFGMFLSEGEYIRYLKETKIAGFPKMLIRVGFSISSNSWDILDRLYYVIRKYVPGSNAIEVSRRRLSPRVFWGTRQADPGGIADEMYFSYRYNYFFFEDYVMLEDHDAFVRLEINVKRNGTTKYINRRHVLAIDFTNGWRKPSSY